jgi:hypothetical protein
MTPATFATSRPGVTGGMVRRLAPALIAACLAALAVPAAAAQDAAACDVIRARIGQLPPADPELLRTLALRKECRFTAAEVYRAAYGDKPMPKYDESRWRHRQRHRERDDDDG